MILTHLFLQLLKYFQEQIPLTSQVLIEYEIIDSQQGPQSHQLTKSCHIQQVQVEQVIVLLKNPIIQINFPNCIVKYQTITFYLSYFRACYIGPEHMMAKLMKILELQYPMIQILITKNIQCFDNQSEGIFNAIHCFSLY